MGGPIQERPTNYDAMVAKLEDADRQAAARVVGKEKAGDVVQALLTGNVNETTQEEMKSRSLERRYQAQTPVSNPAIVANPQTAAVQKIAGHIFGTPAA
ncbi:MAG: hypothetical protein S4CHLAM45_02150 [Chlamydiales bacterium]|nr:hypothetical protein [Chlamydiales bacterium]MCH9620351.1 hypothetical protein [Chlamydiales bacterium]MCH9622337.1 hypothetical protein [Chlamydiales bacterium]